MDKFFNDLFGVKSLDDGLMKRGLFTDDGGAGSGAGDGGDSGNDVGDADKGDKDKGREPGATPDGDKGGADGDKGQDGDKDGKDGKDKDIFTKDEVLDLVQREADRRVTEALKKARKKWEDELKEKERLEKMSQEEREKELLEKTKKEIEARERELQMKQLRLDTIDLVKEMDMPLDFVDFVMAEDLSSTKERAKKLKDVFKQAVEKAVKDEKEKILKGSTPEHLDDKGGKQKQRPKPEYEKEKEKAEKTGNVLGLLRHKFASND